MSPDRFAPLQTPDAARISDYVDHWARENASAIAAVQDETKISYATLRRQVDELAEALAAAGVTKGDRVASLVPPSLDFLKTFLAAASIGAIWLGLSPRHTVDELAYVIGDAEPRLIFHRRAFLGRDLEADLQVAMDQAGSTARLVALDEAHLQAFCALDVETPAVDLAASRAAVAGEDPAMLVYTSGSTGRPKGALVTHRGLVIGGRRRAAVWSASPASLVHFLPVNHIGGAGDLTAYMLVQGGGLVFQEKFEPQAYLALAARERVTVLAGIPTPLQMCAEHLDDHDLSQVQLVVFGGAAPPVELVRRYSRLTPRIAGSYGMTESCASITLLSPNSGEEPTVASVGFPNPDFDVRIAAPDAEGIGEVEIKGAAMSPGYWRRPEANAEVFSVDGYFRTGDLGRWRPDGRLALTGRSREMFKSGGYNVYPREVELALEGLEGVAAAAVVAAPDPVFAEIGVAFVTPESDAQLAPEQLKSACRGTLAHYKTPKHVVVVADFPLLANGKIDKIELRRRAAALVAA